MIPEKKGNQVLEIPEGSPMHLIYKMAKAMTDDIFVELKKSNDLTTQLDIPIHLGDDMIITISRGTETAAYIAIEKAKAN